MFSRSVIAFVFGALAGLAFEPFGLIPLLWLSFPALFFLLQGAKAPREAFTLGWSFAFGFLIICLHWIAGALFVEIKSFWWAVPLAVLGLPAFFALYYGVAALAARRFGLSRGVDVFFFALTLFLAEMARAHLLTGFPWDLMGYVWADTLPVLQSVSLIGVEGLTLLTIMLACLPALFFVKVSRKTAVAALVVGGLLLVGGAMWGHQRLAQAPQDVEEGVRLRLVQPNLPQSLKWKPEHRFVNFQNLMRLTFETKSEKPPTHIIWPETATSYYLAEEPIMRQRIAEMMPQDGVLLTGVVRRAETENPDAPHYYNSLIAMDDKGTVIAGYDKHHLVPFGEYMPLRAVIPFRVVTALGTDFSAGEGVRTVRAPGLPPFSPLVCYEAIFSGAVAEAQDRPRFLLNVTNDAWYKGTIGPAQHFMITRVRAVEEGMPLVRIANGGVTGVVDSYGRIIAVIDADQEGILDAALPKTAVRTTPVSIFGTAPVWLMFSTVLILLLLSKFFTRMNT